MWLKIKDFLGLYNDDSLFEFLVYNEATGKSEIYHHKQEVIKTYGYNSLRSWELENGRLKIIVRTEF